MKYTLIVFCIISVLCIPRVVNGGSLADLVADPLGDIASDFIEEGISGLFDSIFGIGKKLDEIIDKLNEVLQDLQYIEYEEQQILQELQVVSLDIQKRVLQEELRNPLAVINALSDDFYIYTKLVQSNLSSNLTISSDGQNLALRLIDRIEESIETAVERINEGAIDYINLLLKDMVANAYQPGSSVTEIVSITLNTNYALNTFGKAYMKAAKLLSFAQSRYSYLEAGVNNTQLYYKNLKAWHDVNVRTSLTPMITSLLNNTPYAVPPVNGIRNSSYTGCINVAGSAFVSSLVAAGSSCALFPNITIVPIAGFSGQNPLFYIMSNTAYVNVTPAGNTGTIALLPNITGATLWKLAPLPPNTTLVVNQTLNYFQFQTTGLPTNYYLSSILNVTVVNSDALTLSPNPNYVAIALYQRCYMSFSLFSDIPLTFTTKPLDDNMTAPLLLDWNSDITIDQQSSLKNQWLYFYTGASGAIFINRYYNYALTSLNNTQLVLAPLYAPYAQQIGNTYYNQLWNTQQFPAGGTIWSGDIWDVGMLLTQSHGSSNMSISLSGTLNSGLNLGFSSIPLTLNLSFTQPKAREQRFTFSLTKIANSTTDSAFNALSTGHTYIIGAWKNASNSISAVSYDSTNSAKSWNPNSIKDQTDTYWLFQQNGSSQLWTISHLSSGIQVCLTMNSTGSALTSPCSNPISDSQQFYVIPDTNLSSFAYQIKSYVGGEGSLNAMTTGGNGDLWNFIDTTNLTGLNSVNGRVRLYYIS